MSRWKPEEGEAFWFVDYCGKIGGSEWVNGPFQKLAYDSGNCFRTKEEAEAAAKKVKALLLALLEETKNTGLLPKCFNVGDFVYDKGNGYGKITFITDDRSSCRIEFDRVVGNFVPSFFTELKQARIRPYNSEEMKSLVGKTVKMRNHAFLISIYNGDSNTVWFNNYKYSPVDLLNDKISIDGKPCGVFEHLDNGEWVE